MACSRITRPEVFAQLFSCRRGLGDSERPLKVHRCANDGMTELIERFSKALDHRQREGQVAKFDMRFVHFGL